MIGAENLERQADTLARAQRHWQGKPETKPCPTVALAREAGSPGTTVAHEVGARLGWPVYDHELLEKVAQESGLRLSLLESVDERNQGWLQESMQWFAAVPQVTEGSYVHHLMQTILSLGAHGGCVIVGRGAAQVLRPEKTLRVRLIGDLEDRIAFAAQRQNLSRKEAARWVEEKDRQRARFIKDHFLKDPTDPHQYDLLLSTSRWSVAECADLIVQAVQRLSVRQAAS